MHSDGDVLPDLSQIVVLLDLGLIRTDEAILISILACLLA
jgi:hypothetical protein